MDNIVDLYELSPMQQGMLFHSLYAPTSGLYIEQRCCRIQDIEIFAFKQAWQQVCNRHSILRTAFHWEEVDKPLQVVLQSVELPWVEQDWRKFSFVEQQAQLTAFLQADRVQGFVLNQAPLMRCALLRVADNVYDFVWSHHHLLLDGWCNAILLKEVIAYYEAACQGNQLFLPEPRPYRDYILWLQQQDASQAEQFWRRTLQGFTTPTPLLNLTYQNSRSSSLLNHRQQQFVFSQNTTQQLQAFVQCHHLTLNTVVQGAWAILLSRYSQLNDVLFGITVSGRPPSLVGVESMIGLFINTVPVRVQIKPETHLILWLQQLQSQQSEQINYSYSALVDIQAWSDVPRGTPLFESLIVFENYPVSMTEALKSSDLPLQISPLPTLSQAAQTNYPLTLTVLPDAELALQIDYDCERFSDQSINQLLEYLQTLLCGFIDSPEQSLCTLPMLSAAEQQQFWQWNQTHVQYDHLDCIHRQIEAQVALTPDAIALVYQGQHLTYHELNARANHLAHWLQQKNINSPIGVCLDRSFDQIISLLAILKAGAAYLPLDPTYPSERLVWMLKDAQVALVLTRSDVLDSIPELQLDRIDYLLINIQWEIIESFSLDNPDYPIAPNQLAYIIYTSGSTGQPKGVMIPHRGLLNYALAACEKFELTADDRVLQFASVSFDAAAEEIYPTLISGATLVLRTDEMLETAAFFKICRDQQLTILDLPTAYWQQLTQITFSPPPSLRLMIIGGEAASLDSLMAWQRTKIRLLNTYGPTEATIVSTWWDVPSNPSRVAIGQPIPNVQIYVLDSALNSVPFGVAGELCIAGAGVALGYLNQPRLTADKFIPNPFLKSVADPCQSLCLYKTGDRVRYLPDGNLEFLGRFDQQIKLRGFRIELGEIEFALEQHPAIQTAIVTLQSTQSDSQLIAYFVSASVTVPTPTDLRQFLSQSLPSYMLPVAFVQLDAVPLTVSGKIDRIRLVENSVNAELDARQVFCVRPQTPTQEILVNVWAMVLEQSTIGISDSFFELGGHSLRATQIISRIRQIFNVELPLRKLFENPTVAELAQAIEEARQTDQTPVVPIDRAVELPLAYAQQRQWFLAELEPGNPFYNISAAVRVSGSLNFAVLKDSFNEILRRHEVLRTGFHTVQGYPIPRIETTSLEIPLVDLSGLSESLQAQQAEQLVDWEAKQPFALDSPPLLRIKLLRFNDAKYVLLLTLHHIVTDGWSMGILLQELTALYSAFHQGKPSPLAELPIQYVDFAAWQRSQNVDEQLAYWKKQLQAAPVLELPTDHPRPAVRSLRGASHRFQLSPSLTQALQQLSQQMGCTLFMTLLTAFKVLLHRYTDSDDIVVGTVIANRNRAELEGLIGFFVNTLALRTNLAGNPTFETLLHQVRETALAAYAHQDLPFEQLVDALQLQRSLSHTPLFQVLFVLQNAPMPSIELEDISWTPLESDSGTAKFDLTLSMQEETDYLSGTLEYSLDLFDKETIERTSIHFQALLEAITTHPEYRLSDFAISSLLEQNRILNWHTVDDKNLYVCNVFQLFEQQVELTPDAIALVYETEQLTYHSLNVAANHLAHYLQSLGVVAGEAVGVYLQRSPDLIISILAILKAGGIYLPLDPSYPAERLTFMLSDAQVRRVVTCSAVPTLQTPFHLQQIRLDLDRDQIAACSAACSALNPNLPITHAHLAYIMYTSGSTGTPKGVCVPHQGIVRLVQQPNYVDLDAEVILQAAPIAFDASTFEIWGALLNRGRVVLLPTHQPDLEQLGQAIAQYQISTLWLTAGLFHLMVEEQLASFKPLRQLLAGGDSLSSQHIQKLLQAYSHIRVINGYGPTENTTFTCCHTVSNSDLLMTAPPIGSPISGTEVYILNRYLQPVPVGVPGELYAAGAGLAQSYLNQPALTAEKFIPNPFIIASRLYKTGDRARYRSDGTIEYLGRFDQQVKIRGFRVELGEVETALTQHPDVQSAMVTTYADASAETGYKRLVAYVVPHATCDSADLRDFLKSKLPDYMIPAAFVTLDALPLTANGKINRSALPAPMLPSPNAAPPRTATETTLCQIWTSVLGNQVGIYDNFFEQGGDSILAIQIVSRANQAGLKITPKQVFQHQTIAELAAVAGESFVGVLAEQGVVVGKVPLTPIQHWFFEQALPHSHHYNQAVLLRVKASLHQQYLEQAIMALLRHHDALRLQFVATEAGWQQQIALPEYMPLICFDYSQLSAIQPFETIESLIEQAAHQLQASLNLSNHLVQVAWFKLGESYSDYLLFIVHHLAIDGVSWRILLEDFQTVYQHLIQGHMIQLPAKTTSFKQWAERLQFCAASEIDQQELTYWSSQSQRCRNHYALPVDNLQGENTGATSDQIRVSLSVEQTRLLLTEVPKAYNTRIQEVLLTALVQAFTQWTGQQSLLVDIETHGRESQWDDLDLSRTVGWFTVITPVLLTVSSTHIETNLRQIKEQLRAIPNHGIGYGILRYLRTDFMIHGTPQPEVSFNYLGQFGSTDTASTLVGLVEQPVGTTLAGVTQNLAQPRRYRIEINGAVSAGQLYLDWSYSRQQYHRSTIARLVHSFQDALLQLIEHAQNPNAGGYTPSDFALAQLDQSQLEAVLAQVIFETGETGGEA